MLAFFKILNDYSYIGWNSAEFPRDVKLINGVNTILISVLIVLIVFAVVAVVVVSIQ